MKKLGVLFAVISAAALTACGNKSDATAEGMAAAVNKSMQKDGNACLGARTWPYQIPVAVLQKDANKVGSVPHQLAVLEAAGLLKSENAVVEVPGLYGKSTQAPVKRFLLTEAARPYLHEKEVTEVSPETGMRKVMGSEICVAKVGLDKVVRWDAPTELGEMKLSTVTFTYKVEQVSDLAKMPEFLAAFPPIKSLLDGAGTKELQLPVKLTSTGWEPNG